MDLLWGLFNTGQSVDGQQGVPGADIGAEAAWNVTTGSRANIVAILDTGIDFNHPDLAANVFTAPRQFSVTINSLTLTCQPGTHGYNALNNSCAPLDDNGHGTHVAGIIGAVGNNSVGVTGVNWTANLMPLKILAQDGTGTTTDAIKAIEFAIQAKAALGADGNVRVLNASWGGVAYSQALEAEIQAANTADMLFVAAAGSNSNDNDVTPHYPASFPGSNVVSVAAVDNAGHLAWFTNYGTTSVDLGAPGSSTYSTLPNNNYGYLGGTSMSAPFVSGAAALVLSVCPSNTATLKSRLLSSVDPDASLAGKTVSGGRLNVGTAIQQCLQPVTAVAVTTNVPSPQATGAQVTVTANATGTTGNYEYQFVLRNPSGVWSVVQPYSSSPSWNWNTGSVGGYFIQVWARNAGSPSNYEAFIGMAFDVVSTTSPVSAVSVTTNVPSPQAVGTQVTVTANATGTSGNYQYQFVLRNPSGVWSVVRAYSSSASWVWNTGAGPAGGYFIQVWARNAGSTSNYEAFIGKAFDVVSTASPPSPVTAVALSPNVPSPQTAGAQVIFTASATGTTGNYEYLFALRNPAGAWSVAQAYGSSPSWTWNTSGSPAGGYFVQVWARNAGSSSAYEAYLGYAFTIN
jgi:subtilisin family serine protease